VSEYPTGNPEKIFKEKLLEISSKDKIALDIGCADGKFTLTIAPHFKKIIGIDTSKINLDIALNNQKIHGDQNVDYLLEDASITSFEDSFFDVAYCRRGPSFYNEYSRILKPNGYYLEIGIGEADTIELKKIFGRGQGYGKWGNSTLDKHLGKLKSLGFETVFADNFHYFEYYPSYKEIEFFLQTVPIFEDFDPQKDKSLLQKFVKEFTTDKGIQLSRHRLVMVQKKSNS